ncbi:unnamed protein product [Lampetra fluviatilis]
MQASERTARERGGERRHANEEDETGVEEGEMADQLGTLKNMLAQWCELGTPRVASEGEGGGPQESVLSSLSPPSATWHEDAILGAAGEERREAAILSSPRRGDAAIFNIAAVMQLRAAIGRCLGESSLL